MTNQRQALDEWLERSGELLSELETQGVGTEKPVETTEQVGKLALDEFIGDVHLVA
jgi:hypothetical protein